MITINAKVLWSVDVDQSGRNLFSNPCGINAKKINSTTVIVVSDWNKDILTLHEAEH